jgi:glycosyltransferase involved in cell wall biosynthesis
MQNEPRSRKFTRPKHGFVLMACGDRYADRVNTCLTYLKRVTRHDIVVLQARSSVPIESDQTIECIPPNHFTDAEASVALKTSLHRVLGQTGHTWCYLDSDVIALDERINGVFRYLRSYVAFARDHVEIDQLSRHVVRCGCAALRCHHLRQQIQEQFKVRIADARWVPWNGGVFVFGPDSQGVLDRWHEFAAASLRSAGWYPRDQGALAAVAWELGLQSIAPLPRRFNWIVDGMRGVPVHLRHRLSAPDLTIDRSYRLDRTERGRRTFPAALHFINDTIGRKGWKNWDDVAALLEARVGDLGENASRRLAIDNRIVHGLWIGESLSRLELLTLHSFVGQGHEFHLWLYEKLKTPIPKGVVVRDANEIIPRVEIFTKKSSDPISGVGKDSYGPFSDLFRYKLLYDVGGWWVDMDVTCLKPFNLRVPYVFRSHRIGVMGNVMKCPRHSHVMRRAFAETRALADENVEWLLPNRILSREVRKQGLWRFVRGDICNDDTWTAVSEMLERDIEVPKHWYGVHWINEVHRTIRRSGGQFLGVTFPFLPDKENPKQGSLLARLYETYGLSDSGTSVPAVASRGAGIRTMRRSQEHVNIVLPTLNTGGAERIVLDVMRSLPPKASARICVLERSGLAYAKPLQEDRRITYELLGDHDWQAKLKRTVARVRASTNHSVYVHMPDEGLLQYLHSKGVRTIPVIHNTHKGWTCSATALNDPGVLFVVCVARAVARDLRAFGCHKRIVVIRHEVDFRGSASDHAANRDRIRKQLRVPKRTALIGMIGQFKRQKQYPRAVRVLEWVRRHTQAKLVILGGCDPNNPSSRSSYEETQALTRSLGLEGDVIALGNVQDVGSYLDAFDVFLNTSAYEGLSVAMLEAQRSGCRIVASDVGGASELDHAGLRRVSFDSSDEEFAAIILDSLRKPRPLAAAPPGDGLIPFLWTALANYGWRAPARCSGVRLHLCSGPSMEKQANQPVLSAGANKTLCGVYGDAPPRLRHALRRQGIRTVRLSEAGNVVATATAALRLIAATRADVIYFEGIDVRLRLLLAKVLPPSIVLIDRDGPNDLSDRLAVHQTLQRRLCLDGSEYYARLHTGLR